MYTMTPLTWFFGLVRSYRGGFSGNDVKKLDDFPRDPCPTRNKKGSVWLTNWSGLEGETVEYSITFSLQTAPTGEVYTNLPVTAWPRLTNIKTPFARAEFMPPAVKMPARPRPTAGSTPNENAWVSRLRRILRAAPATSPTLIVSPTRKNARKMPTRVIHVRDEHGMRTWNNTRCYYCYE